MSNQKQSASSGRQELPAHSLPLLGWLLLCPTLSPCPAALLQAWQEGMGASTNIILFAGCGIFLALLARMCLCQQILASASPADSSSAGG